MVKVLHLTKSDGVVVGLGADVEVHRLFDLVMTLVVSGQVVRRCSVTRRVGDLKRLKEKKKIIPFTLIFFTVTGGARAKTSYWSLHPGHKIKLFFTLLNPADRSSKKH